MSVTALFRTSLNPSRGPAGKRPLHPVAQRWIDCFGDALPAGFLCRQSSLDDRWLRVHSLPLSKRYPDDNAELAEVLRRQNAVASELLGEGSLCLLFFAHMTSGTTVPRWSCDAEWLDELDGKPELVLTVEETDDHDQMAFFARQVTWQAGAFDQLITARANDRCGSLLFANLSRGSIYAPYDGGADLFYPTWEDVEPAESRHRDWLPHHPQGL